MSTYKTATSWIWNPTVVNPTEQDTMEGKLKTVFHIFVWLVAIGLSSAQNFGVSEFQKKSADCTAAKTDCFESDPSDSTTLIAMAGSISMIVGVLVLLAGAAYFNAQEFVQQTTLNVTIQFLTLYGTTATFFVWTQAAEKDDTPAYWLGLFATLVSCYAQVLLYCTSSTLDVIALPRAFLPCFALSIQIISAIAISGGDWKNTQGANSAETEFSDAQKFAAWCVPVCLGVSIVLMLALRGYTTDRVTGFSELGEHPFYRSLVLTPFLLSGILAAYKLSFVKADDHPTGFLFSLVGMMLTFGIINVVFVPSSKASGGPVKGTLVAGTEI